MELDVRDGSRVCRGPPGPRKDLNWHMKPRTRIMAVSLTLILTTSGLAYYLMQPTIIGGIPDPWEGPEVLIPHGAIAIDGDADFTATALLEGWPGDGSPENPYIIDGLDINLTITTPALHCISIGNTRVSFIISNCSLTGAGGDTPWQGEAGIYLGNVSNCELVNNTCTSNETGINLYGSDSNTIANNTCINNECGIWLSDSDSNTVSDNTCNYNRIGIVLGELDLYSLSLYSLGESDYNTVTNNICNNNECGISLGKANSNTIANNTCINNDIGINLENSDSNTVSDNICNYNRIGISLDDESYYNIVANNTFVGNTEHDIVGESETEEDGIEEDGIEEDETEEFDPVVLLLIGPVVGIIMLGAAWRMLSGIRRYD